MMSDRSETVLPVPEGISSRQWPWERKTQVGRLSTHAGIERPLQIGHVLVLLCGRLDERRSGQATRVDLVIREDDLEVVNLEQHRGPRLRCAISTNTERDCTTATCAWSDPSTETLGRPRLARKPRRSNASDRESVS